MARELLLQENFCEWSNWGGEQWGKQIMEKLWENFVANTNKDGGKSLGLQPMRVSEEGLDKMSIERTFPAVLLLATAAG